MTIFGAFIFALLFSMLFAPGYRSGSYFPLLILFFLLFMAGIASQYWITPFGPVWWGVSWVPLLFIILIVTFLFAAPSPYERKNISTTTDDKQVAAKAAVAVVSIYVWLLFIILLITILAGIFKSPAL